MNLSQQWWRSKTFISKRRSIFTVLLILKTLNCAQRRDRDDVINKHLTSIIHSESFLPSLVLPFVSTELKKKKTRAISDTSSTLDLCWRGTSQAKRRRRKERQICILKNEKQYSSMLKTSAFHFLYNSQPFLVLSTTWSVQLCGQRERLTTTNIYHQGANTNFILAEDS